MIFTSFSDGTMAISFEQLMQFITGSREIPPSGLSPQPIITFHHSTDWRHNGTASAFFIKANTCANNLILPVDNVDSYATFRQNFQNALELYSGFTHEEDMP